MRRTIILIALLSFPTAAQFTFVREYDLTEYDDEGYQIAKRSDGGFVVVGQRGNPLYPYAGDPIWIITDSTGTLMDSGTAPVINYGRYLDVIILPGGLFVACGDIYTSAVMSMFAPNGDPVWHKTYLSGSARGMCKAADNGYAIVGGPTPTYQGFFIRTDSNGDTLSTRVYPHFYYDNTDEFTGVALLSDSGFIISGTVQYFFPLLVRVNQYGDTLWSRMYSLSAGGYAATVAVDTDSSFITAGVFGAFAMRHTIDGDSLWTRFYGTGSDGGFIDMIVIPADGYLFAGFVPSVLGDRDGFIVRTDVNGDTLWTRVFHGSFEDDHFYSCARTDDGGFVFSGSIGGNGSGPPFSRMWLVKTDSLGNVENVPPTITNTTIWHDTSFTGPFVVSATITDNQILDTTRLVLGYDPQYDPMLPPDSIVGDTHYFTIPAVTDTTWITYRVAAWDISLNQALDSVYEFLVEPTDVPWSSSLPTTFSLHPPAPNPFNASTRISFSLPEPAHVRLEVFDLLGRRIAVLKDEPMRAGEHAVVWDASVLSSGVYLARLRTHERSAVQKILLLK